MITQLTITRWLYMYRGKHLFGYFTFNNKIKICDFSSASRVKVFFHSGGGLLPVLLSELKQLVVSFFKSEKKS